MKQACCLAMCLTLIFNAIVQNTSAQICGITINAGNDTTLCMPGQLQLNGTVSVPSSGIINVQWTPTSGLSNAGILNPVLNVSSTSQYILTVTAISGNNSVVNGDFSAGNSGFTTNYVPGTGGSFGVLSNEGEFDISTDPSLSHIDFSSFGDHTTGSGNMMVINGAAIPTEIWCQTVPVNPNTEYDFSAWMVTCFPTNPAILQFSINGALLGSPFSLSSSTGIWEQFSETWNSGNDTTAQICIVNQSTAIGGNDFAIDDIYLSEVCTLSDTIEITLTNDSVNLGQDTTICSGAPVVLNAFLPNASAYTWNTGSTDSVLVVTLPDTYSVAVLIDSTCIVTDTIIIGGASLDVDLGNDTTLCSGSFFLDSDQPPSVDVLWNTGQMTNAITIDTAGLYIVTVSSGTCSDVDSINVAITSPLTLTNDTILCPGNSLQLNAAISGAQQYIWNTGDTSSSINVLQAGSYSVTVFLNNCIVTDSVNVTTPQPPDLGEDITACNPVTVSAFIPEASSYLWNTGETTSAISVENSGNYIAFATIHANCILSDTIEVAILPIDADIDSSLVYVNPGDPVTVNASATGSPPFTYSWTPATNINCTDCPSPVITAFENTTYSVTVTDANGCMDNDIVTFILQPCEQRLFFPNAFTPNNDGINDNYYVPAFCPGPFRFILFNRWGEPIFETEDPFFSWNGKRHGTGDDSPEGTYFFLCKTGEDVFRGAVILLR